MQETEAKVSRSFNELSELKKALGETNRTMQLKEQTIKVNKNRIEEVQNQLDGVIRNKINKLAKIAVNFENFDMLKSRMDGFEHMYQEDALRNESRQEKII